MDCRKLQQIIDDLTNNKITKLEVSFELFDLQQLQLFAAALQNNTSLQRLVLKSIDIQDADIQIREPLGNDIKTVELLAAILKVNTSITTLIIDHCEFSGASLKVLVNALKHNTTVKKFTIQFLDANIDAMQAVTGMLHTNTTLTELNLLGPIASEPMQLLMATLKCSQTIAGLGLDISYYDKQAALHLVKGLEHTAIQSMALKYLDTVTVHPENKLPLHNIVEIITNGLIFNEQIKTIDIQHWYFNESNFGLVRAMLEGNKHISTLKLSHCTYTDKACCGLEDFLCHNETLTRLYIDNLLNYSMIGKDRPITAIVTALKINTSLTALALKGCYFNEKNSHDLAEALKINDTLQDLNLNYSYFFWSGLSWLAESIQINTTLEKLSVRHNFVLYDRVEYFAGPLKFKPAVIAAHHDNCQRYVAAFDKSLKHNTNLIKFNLDVPIWKMLEDKMGPNHQAAFPELTASIVYSVQENINLRRDLMLLALLYGQAVNQPGIQRALPNDMLLLIFKFVTASVSSPWQEMSKQQIFQAAANKQLLPRLQSRINTVNNTATEITIAKNPYQLFKKLQVLDQEQCTAIAWQEKYKP